MSAISDPGGGFIDQTPSVDSTRAVLSVLGVNKVGIVAGVATLLARHMVNILDIRQTLLGDLFSMVMVVDLADSTASMPVLKAHLDDLEDEFGVKIYLQHEAIFRYMHRVNRDERL